MFKKKLTHLIKKKNSLLCVGLDMDMEKIPRYLLREEDPLLIFNREIIEATRDVAVAYKTNIAFFEALGSNGWHLLEQTLSLLPQDTLVLADAKRADIGNSSRKYAETFFNTYPFDAVTVSPYMGLDSIEPFLQFSEKGIFVLCLTSNRGSRDFQYLATDGDPLYLTVARQVVSWDMDYGNCGLVVGATHPEDIGTVREAAPSLPFLIPGIGSQGGNLALAVQYGTDREGGCALINSSRSIIYASGGKDFAEAAAAAAQNYTRQINQYRAIT
ncbi:MAG: orotidine-5'-phosphate decarboxylase [Calditrichia bacterium]